MIPDSFREKALKRGRDIARRDLAAAGAFTIGDVMARTGMCEADIRRLVAGHTMLCVASDGGDVYPAIQFTEQWTIVRGLRDVYRALQTENGYAVLNFLLHSDHRLGNRKPIDLLRKDDVRSVLEAARRWGEQGA